MNTLEKIIAHKKEALKEQKTLYPIALLQKSIYFNTPVVSLKKYLKRPDKSGIIAEFKRQSPSKGAINPYASVEEVTIGYMQAGASALSVLTDSHFFGGKNDDLTTARNYNFCPVLRKDFIIDEYQIIESKSIGADAVLLIAACLSKEELKNLYSLAKSLGLEVLLEIHHEEELEKILDNEMIIGVNNRDLKTFEVSINQSIKMYDLLPKNAIKISESGIKSVGDIYYLKEVGYDGFLIGETFMKTPNPSQACFNFIKELKNKSNANKSLRVEA